MGRLGAWPQKLAEAGLFALAVANSHRHGHFVVPWGGREGRLATNPLAWAAPHRRRPPAAGHVDEHGPGRPGSAPPCTPGSGCPRAASSTETAGPPSTPPDFYGPGEGPPAGAILPFGGDRRVPRLRTEPAGWRSSARPIAGEPLAEPDDGRYINGFGILAIDPAALAGSGDRFRELTGELRDYVRSSAPAPGFEEVLMPGEREFRTLRGPPARGHPPAGGELPPHRRGG